MMFRLRGDVVFHALQPRVADAKRRVAGLPRERMVVGERLMDPFGRVGLDDSQGPGNGHLLAQPGQQVNVVGHTAGGKQTAVLAANDSTNVVVKARLEVGRDKGSALLGAENQVVVQACEGLRQGRLPGKKSPKIQRSQGLTPLANDGRPFGAEPWAGLLPSPGACAPG